MTLLADLAEAEAIAGQSAAEPRGTVRITCSHGMAEQRVAPAIATFVERHPAVKFDLVVSDRFVDLVEEGFDLAVRVGPVGSDRLVARRLGTMRLLLCASPAYLERRGTPGSVEALAEHDGLTYAYSSTPRLWRFTGADGRVHEVRVAGKLHANSGEALRSAAMAGLGLIYEPDFLVAEALRGGQLVRVLPEYADYQR